MRVRRLGLAVLAVGLVGGLLPGSPARAQEDGDPPAEGSELLKPLEFEPPGFIEPPVPEPAPELPQGERPGRSAGHVSLAGPGVERSVGEGPVRVAAVSKAGAGRSVGVEVLDAELADQVGAVGFLFRVSDLDEGDCRASR